MDESKKLKYLFEIAQTVRQEDAAENANRSNSKGDGFFELFGSLLEAKSNEDDLDLNKFQTTDCDTVDEVEKCDESLEKCDESVEKWNLTKLEELVLDDAPEKSGEVLATNYFMNIEDLYEEILYEITNDIGQNSGKVDSETLIDYAQNVFKISKSVTDGILANICQKEPPKMRLNVEVIKAENILPKDPNGLSDPFVTLYLESKSSHRYNSSVKLGTLNPVWEEHFSLPIENNPNDEMLTIEVWDFDAAETVKEKVHKILDVKGIKGLSKLMKEIALTASTGKHDNELIGRSTIAVKAVPVSGLTLWCNLEKRRTRSRGSILLNLTLSAEKNKQLAIQEHRNLLNLLLLHEIDTSKMAPFWWCGKFCAEAETIRTLHSMHGGLSTFECALCQWVVYTNVHEKHPLSFSLFNNLLEIILPVLKCRQNDSEDVKVFWDGVRDILPSCFSVLRKMRSKTTSDKGTLKMLCEVLRIFHQLRKLSKPENVELFPKNVYGWLSIDDNENLNIDTVLVECIYLGTNEWFERIVECNLPNSANKTDDDQLQSLIRIVQMIRSDLQRAMEFYDKHFYCEVHLNYSAVLFEYFENKLIEVCKPVIEDICSHIKRIEIPIEDIAHANEFNMGTSLFELYLVIKKLITLGRRLCPNRTLSIEKYYEWFIPGVTHWLDISVVKALNRIQKAITLDQLQAIDNSVKYSSSAVDTLAIFYQIRTFWNQLDWPDVEGRYTFVAKIVDDICRCCVFYAQRISNYLDTISSDTETELFEVSIGWCLAINNIDYIQTNLPAFIQEFGINNIIHDLGEYRSSLEAERCATTINNVIDNAVDIGKNQILELIDRIAVKMSPCIQRFLTEGAEVLHEGSQSMEKLMMYLENSLQMLYTWLTDENFQKILEAIWIQISVIMNNLIQINLNKRRPPAFFKHLEKTLNTMIKSFNIGEITISNVSVLNSVEKLLKLHGLETMDLIHKYYMEQMEIVQGQSEAKCGLLTIQSTIVENRLELKVLNAINLGTVDNSECNSFVKIQIFPGNAFHNANSIKTAVQHKTRFPLYDEEFSIPFSGDQSDIMNCLIIFTIKDKDLFGLCQFIGEAYISIEGIAKANNEQIHLNLNRPRYSESVILSALEHRSGDKQAKDFLRKLKKKSQEC